MMPEDVTRATVIPRRTLHVDDHRDAHAAADAERGKPFSTAFGAERVDQRREDARAARADWMAERDRATARVDLCRIEIELPHDGQRLRRERFVQLEEVDVPG